MSVCRHQATSVIVNGLRRRGSCAGCPSPRLLGSGPFLPRATAFTLPEVIGSLMILSVVMVAIGSTIVMASRALPGREVGHGTTIKQAKVVQQIVEDLSSATRFLGHGETMVRFMVDDRDGNGTQDTLSYQWSGTQGTPLTLQFNNAAALELFDGVRYFNLEYLVEPRRRPARVLMVCDGPDGVSSDDTKRIERLKSLGVTVARIEDSASQDAYDAAVAVHDVVYVPSHIQSRQLRDKLHHCPIGVVSEHRQQIANLGIATNFCRVASNDQIAMVSTAHSITGGLPSGNIPLSTDAPLARIHGTVAPGAQILVRSSTGNHPALVVVEKGAMLVDGGEALGRRVQLPWGTGPEFNFEELTVAAMELAIRAIDWAAGNQVVAVVGINLHGSGETTPMMETKVAIMNRPTVAGP